MAAKPKMTPEQWANTRKTWEADPRKPLAWLIEELGLPVSAEALRLRAKSEGWVKVGVEDSKLGKAPKPKLALKVVPEIPSLEDGAQENPEDQAAELVELPKPEQQSGATLTPREERFVQEYLIDLNATQAYMRSSPHVKESTANTEGPRTLGIPRVSAAVEKAKAERAKRTEISADQALLDVWNITRADARELVQVKVGCCRHCYGEGHQRQRTVGEMNRAREKHVAKGKDVADFDEEGGIGFNPHLPPNPECPECCGDGHARVVLADTRNLSPQAAALYAGAKHGKNGIEVMSHSKAEAQRKVFEHLGLNKQVIEVNLNVFPPREVLDAVYAKGLAEAAERESLLRGRRERMGIVIENGDLNG